MIDFMHESTLLITDNGLKSISALKNEDKIVCINKFGCMEYYSPLIESSQEMGMYYQIVTDIGTLNLSANSMMYYDGGYRKKLLVHDVATTLVGKKIRIPSIPLKSNYYGTGRPISNLVLYAVKNVKDAQIINSDWLKIHVSNKNGMHLLDDLLDHHHVVNKLNWYALVNKDIKSKTYHIRIDKSFKKGLSSKVPEVCNAIEAKKFIEVFILFSSFENTKQRKKILVDHCNLHIVLALALKAGYTCSVVQYLSYSRCDYIILTKDQYQEFKILDVYLAQNESNNLRPVLPERYMGIACISEGNLFIHAI